ncbi:MAG: hypothetical protein ACKORG_05085 [Actinomycetota bacterium]|jgi:hypothetical protein|nr:hypothetical protein [Actinomycetota bacterium]MBM3697895.1 hypothetical protein [Actinomycetota bacterium]
MSDALPPDLESALAGIDPAMKAKLVEALDPVMADLGPREVAVLLRLVNGIRDGASVPELNAFVRLLPVTVSRVVQPVIEPAEVN